jgi:hypothetical protein
MKVPPIHPGSDSRLAGHHGFTDEESHFTPNYGIKYRLGRDTEVEE